MVQQSSSEGLFLPQIPAVAVAFQVLGLWTAWVKLGASGFFVITGLQKLESLPEKGALTLDTTWIRMATAYRQQELVMEHGLAPRAEVGPWTPENPLE
ncbi:hypothetical protein JX265_008858 [Neoarthrinium moseri]|uniref:Uncharacterized protein n=1 Tax=Neoarthrinium moseri TaxID=1658444 RepID=A0A9P9WHM8_9PEZI|nr:uncharacterized protein JN550_009574 [Neoarthrinium moseri]KAI1848362.1 hypothetical protein JX266_005668 [Neoarthrinium moseri]KAI1863463.1 hypothetical protein JN550_009574 [Neoarthrinium moseri]KAI1863641.1 hypothetical protein JX265_008858 [Neoarthrinium moseri]